MYVYKDENGNTVKTGLLEKDKIPKNVKRKIFKLNICDKRIRTLNNIDIDESKKEVNMHPKICGMNTNKDGSVKTLEDEPGMIELMQLYLDDNYDYSNGTFTGMSDSTKKQFEKDLKTFYAAFTGKEDMPSEITKFSDIKLRDYNNQTTCQGENPIFKQNYIVSNNDKLFLQYAKNIKNMIQSASDKQSELLNIINELFIFVNDPYSDKKKIRVNPILNEEKLQQIIVKTRNIIIELYVKCELDFIDNLKVYEAIVESKILETTKKQIENLEKKANSIISETNKIIETAAAPAPAIAGPMPPVLAPAPPVLAPMSPIASPAPAIVAPMQPVVARPPPVVI